MRYVVEKVLPYAPSQVWGVLSDVAHYVDGDPFHHDLVFVGDQRQGVGTTFDVRHSYLPIFPFRSDTVRCRISTWNPEKEQLLDEINSKSYRDHTQHFVLTPMGNGTKLRFEVAYMGIPAWLLPWRWWVKWMVVRRLREKLGDVEAKCRTVKMPVHPTSMSEYMG